MFRPSLHGWPFGNTDACTGAELGIGGAPPAELGVGGGMCWTALDRYLRAAAIPRGLTPPEPGDPLHTELRQRQVAALAGVWPRIRDWHGQSDGSWRDALPVPIPLPGGDLASRTRAGWRTLRRRLDAGEPVLLTLLPHAGGYDRPRSFRQVLATGWQRNGFRVTLSLYDPDRPDDDDVYLGFNLAGELDAKTSGGRTVRGFFPVDYDRGARPVLRAEAFDDRSVIGLKRNTRGRPAPAVGRNRITLLARNERGALLHFWRVRGQHWESVNVTDAEDLGAFELHSDPTAVQRMGTLHGFARSYTGDLLHFRRFRSWSVANRTDQKRAGPRFRLAGQPVPVPGPRLQLSVLGRDPSGGLVHYHTAPFRGWRAEQVPGDPVTGDPVAAWADDALHVVGVGAQGRILHWVRREVWSMTDTEAGPGPDVRLAGRPALDIRDGRVRIFGRSQAHELAILEADDDGVWERSTVASDLAADPVCCTGPGGLHVFAPTTPGGLVHAWRTADGWNREDVITSRATLPLAETGEAEIAAWGDSDSLRVFVRRGSRLRAFTWTPDADWVADPVTERADSRPVAFRDARNAPHVVFTDGRGTILHVETGAWQEPGAGSPAAPRTVQAHRPAEGAPASDAGADSLPPEEEAPPLPLLDLEVPAAEAAPAEAPASPEAPANTEGPVVFEFDRERRAAGPALEPTDAEPTDAEPADARPAEAEAAAVPEPAETPPDASGPEPSPDADGAEESGAGAGREFRWEDRPPPVSPDQIEPMDLSLLDTWPPTRRSRRNHEERPSQKNPNREAS